MGVNQNQYSLPLLKNTLKIIQSLLTQKILHILKLFSGFILKSKLVNIIFSKWQNQCWSDRKIEKDLGSCFNLKILSKAHLVTVIFCQLQLELLKNILNSYTDFLSLKKTQLICMELDFLSRELGELCFLMLAFQSVVQDIFLELNLIISRYG